MILLHMALRCSLAWLSPWLSASDNSLCPHYWSFLIIFMLFRWQNLCVLTLNSIGAHLVIPKQLLLFHGIISMIYDQQQTVQINQHIAMVAMNNNNRSYSFLGMIHFLWLSFSRPASRKERQKKNARIVLIISMHVNACYRILHKRTILSSHSVCVFFLLASDVCYCSLFTPSQRNCALMLAPKQWSSFGIIIFNSWLLLLYTINNSYMNV